ncbi:hypothetical protein T11_15955 [Trichinella zimbabwensis]|uniref:Uncharacterized protein n=1 Tax=Trichinella zimbabwensis TaxID=268475 RepID=A0A0V1FKX4_9BILA|nr:hypothetical protein T11_15955 [Trichinella zimbabwensis]
MWLQQRLKGTQFTQNKQIYVLNILRFINNIKKGGYHNDSKEL